MTEHSARTSTESQPLVPESWGLALPANPSEGDFKMFIRDQFSPYCITVERLCTMSNGFQWYDEVIIPVMKFIGPVPHGRHDHTGSPNDWGPDQFGYTDFDDYHLNQYGA